jgi:ribosome-associated toxin RatA of RatAB toxin-antitoxin module
MRTVDLLIDVPGKSAHEVYDALADFERYPDLADAVKSVVVTSVADDVTRSQWEVAFRAGLLRWTEEDRFDRVALTIDFRQTEGDVALFDGSWRCTDAGTGARIVFSARLDMGIPSLADALEPIAARTLVENTVAIVGGLLGEAHLVDSVVAAVEPQSARAVA